MPVLQTGIDSYTNPIHADDLCTAFVAAIHRGRPNRSYNICDASRGALKMNE